MSDDVFPDDIRGYHRRTKHAPNRYALGPAFLDWESQPDGFRRFDGAPLLALPLALTAPTPPFGQWDQVPARPLTPDTLGLFLELALGLSAWKEAQGARWPLRNNPSSGNLHPTEGWVVVPAAAGMDTQPGLFHYAPREHGLEQRRRLTAMPAALAPGQFLLALSSVPWREAWKYGERAFRYCQHDVGHAVAAASFAAACLGWGLRILAVPGDDTLAALLGLDRDDAAQPWEREYPDLVAVVGPGPLDEVALGTGDGDWAGRANRLSDDHDPWPVLDRALRFTHRAEGAGSRALAVPSPVTALTAVSPVTALTAVSPVTALTTMSPVTALPAMSPVTALPAMSPRPAAGTVIRRRRSAQRMKKGAGLDRDTFLRLLAATLPVAGAVPWRAFPWAARLNLAAMVHQVDGMEPGLYLLARAADRLDALRAAADPAFLWQSVPDCPLPLVLLEARDLRTEASSLSCLQAIAGHGAFCVSMVADFARTLAEDGDWAYRRLHWEAGMVGQALYLEATAAGHAGTGIGCFFDDAAVDLLGLDGPALDWQALYHFTVGDAVEDSRIQSHPAYAGRD